MHVLLNHALESVVEASAEIMAIYKEDFDKIIKEDGSPVTKADLASNVVISKHLSKTAIPFITEESVHQPFEERENWSFSWCVDPLDGTKEFIKKNDEFAICIALIHNQKPVLGIIASPVNQNILIGGKDVPAAVVSFDRIHAPDTWNYIEAKQTVNTPLVLAGSRSHHSGTELKFNTEMRETFGEITFVKKGSALKFFDLALGIADVYPRFAPTMEWDIAAGQAIMESLGGQVLHAETNEPLQYNKANLVNPYFVVKSFAAINHSK